MARPPRVVQILHLRFTDGRDERVQLARTLTEEDVASHLEEGLPLRVDCFEDGVVVDGVINTVNVTFATLLPADQS